jgi:hypothetical protein
LRDATQLPKLADLGITKTQRAYSVSVENKFPVTCTLLKNGASISACSNREATDMLRHDWTKPGAAQGLLQADIGLIAVDDEYAVFTIRIPRAKLAENHFFLNTISDIAAVGDQPPGREEG